MKSKSLSLCLLSVIYFLIIFPFTSYMNSRPVAIKLGFMPEAKVLKLIAGDYRQILAQNAVVRVLFYFGSLVEPSERTVHNRPDFFQMFTTLQQAVRLDPYNMDAYYFTQAAFTWELRRIKEVNDILDYGMEFRTWDAQLPFYAAFNCAFFQKDYTAASKYMKMAAERSGDPLYTNLAARYFHEAGQTTVGLAFIEQMDKTSIDPRVKKLYRLRKEALQGVQIIESAAEKFHQHHGQAPESIDQLESSGYIDKLPVDPYGGHFYLTPEGSVRSTSKFAFAKSGVTE